MALWQEREREQSLESSSISSFNVSSKITVWKRGRQNPAPRILKLIRGESKKEQNKKQDVSFTIRDCQKQTAKQKSKHNLCVYTHTLIHSTFQKEGREGGGKNFQTGVVKLKGYTSLLPQVLVSKIPNRTLKQCCQKPLESKMPITITLFIISRTLKAITQLQLPKEHRQFRNTMSTVYPLNKAGRDFYIQR